ncbi:MAG: HAD family hydrolase [Elainella sp. Prado103]|nr:HAD family hydrolase [Elainella sp. Prado103]
MEVISDLSQVEWRSNPQPQVIFLDAVGTLFGVRGSVGEMYLNVTRQFGVEMDAQLLDQAFYQSFKSMPFPMAFPGVAVTDIPGKEYDWWQQIAVDTFQRAGIYDRFADFSAFFAQLYHYFASPAPWIIYPETFTMLEFWRQKGVKLGILSNFDTRIHPVLQALNLSNYFDSVTISTEVGAAKPNAEIFQAALAKHDCLPEQAWHIGDSLKEDYEGAKSSGIRAFWLDRV